MARVCGPADRGWQLVIDRMGVLLAMKVDSRDVIPVVLPDQLGVVLGRLFTRGGEGEPMRLVEQLSIAEAFELVSAGGKALTLSHWGSYCAILHDRFANVLRVIRDPMGARPIYHTTSGGLSIAFTHLADLFAAGVDAEIDDQGLRGFLTDVRLVSERTGIVGVRELLAGCELRLGQGGAEVSCVWRPEQRRKWTGGSFTDAVTAVRGVAAQIGEAWGGALPRALHRLSGGLDSSIALSLLVGGQLAEIVAVNEYSSFAESDEREQARAAAFWFGTRLIEREIHPDQIDYSLVLSQEPEAKPTLAALGFADDGLATIAPDFAGGPLTSGQGGDQIFHRSSRAVLVADAVRDGLPVNEVWKVAYDNALLGRRPVWEGVGAALKYGLLRLPSESLAQLDSPMMWRLEGVVDSDAFLMEEWGAHPWRTMKETPARAERVRRIIDLTYYHQPSPLTLSFQNCPVLTSQPLVETCLSVAPYLMSAHAVDRALVREAFAESLPPAVLKRQSKGDTTRFVAALLRRNGPFARDMLCSGRLVERGILTTETIEQLISPRATMNGTTKARLMRSLVAELWLRRVEAARMSTRASGSSMSQDASGLCA